MNSARMLGDTKQPPRCIRARQGCTCYIPRDLFGSKGNRKIRRSGRATEKRTWRREL